jgi:hypothetical protein
VGEPTEEHRNGNTGRERGVSVNVSSWSKHFWVTDIGKQSIRTAYYKNPVLAGTALYILYCCTVCVSDNNNKYITFL